MKTADRLRDHKVLINIDHAHRLVLGEVQNLGWGGTGGKCRPTIGLQPAHQVQAAASAAMTI